MIRKFMLFAIFISLLVCFAGCTNGENMEEIEESLAGSDVLINNYYTNEQGVRVDKVTEFEIKTFGDYELKIPILNEGTDEVVVYEFDTYTGTHVVIDALNVYQQTNLDELGDYGDVQLEEVASGEDIIYMYDGERYYIEDYGMNLLTISKPTNN